MRDPKRSIEYKRFVIDETMLEAFLSPVSGRDVFPAAGNLRLIHASFAGVIARIQVARGQKVKRGERLLVVQDRESASEILSPRDGVVRALSVARGEKVAQGQTLIELDFELD